ncbi:hypothetical protein QBC38DRAFT_516439 [Podospora fimiseda]|uniref:CorA-like transporter domain-containing protein n=1 Tax=Podospora fimiseda TaxID=252190 RepID=A0AAN7GP50_9PEZI|nr:hypothetical protein QBC38DRAFT_516439 [Podospora fimiseda]
MSSTPEIERLVESTKNYRNYPLNLIDKSRWDKAKLEEFHRRLCHAQAALDIFLPPKKRFELPVWDIAEDRTSRYTKNETNADITKRFEVGDEEPKLDPQVRFIFMSTIIYQKPLAINEDAFKKVVSYHQVTPRFLDYLEFFGLRSTLAEKININGLYAEKTLDTPSADEQIPELRRSGRGYQIGYTLKSIDLNVTPAMVKPATIYHRFDLEYGTQLWIFVDHLMEFQRMAEGSQLIVANNVDSLQEQFQATLNNHIVLARWMNVGWREHVDGLPEIMDNRPRKRVSLWTDEGQAFMGTRETLKTAFLSMDMNCEIMGAVRNFYTSIVDDRSFPEDMDGMAKKLVGEFVIRLDEEIEKMAVQRDRAKQLQDIIDNARTIR